MSNYTRFLFCLLFLLGAVSPGLFGGVVYQITEKQLMDLESNLNKQIKLLSEAKQELSIAKGQLTEAVQELLTASENLKTLEQDLTESRALQSQALESLAKLEEQLARSEKEKSWMITGLVALGAIAMIEGLILSLRK